tara:strand:+ start:354 stop:1685 length:1332 start_codon:yes stop_codon:yes gene_type:complete
MLDYSRLICVLELLKSFDSSHKIASKIVQNYFRSNKNLGSRDRKFISSIFWNIIKNRNKIHWHIKNLNFKITYERQVFLELFFLNKDYKNDLHKIKKNFFSHFKSNKIFKDKDLDLLKNLHFNKFFNKDMPIHVFYELPVFLLQSIKRNFKLDWKNVVLSLKKEAFVDIRVNTLKNKTRNEILDSLREIKIPSKITKYSPKGIRLLKRFPINGNKLFKYGNIEIQGEASQLSTLLLGAKPGMQVADICAGAGGKSLLLADIMQNKGRILSLDISQKRLKEASLRFKRAGVHIVDTRLVDTNWNTEGLEKKFDLVLIDAPCSGIGTWARSPDSRFYFNKKKLLELNNIQSELLLKGSIMVAPGGKLAYVICSILPEEGIDQIEKFKKLVNNDFSEIDMVNMWSNNLFLTNAFKYPFDNDKKSITINPYIHKMDGFFISMFQRKI